MKQTEKQESREEYISPAITISILDQEDILTASWSLPEIEFEW